MQSYSVTATERVTATATHFTYGCDLFMVYEPDPASSDPPITADLRWIQVQNAGGKSATEFPQRACPYYFPGGLTSVYGKPACSLYCAPAGGTAVPNTSRGPTTGEGPSLANEVMLESFLVLDTQRQDHAGKGIIDILGGVKWGYQLQAAQS
ncbi:MAG: hypothetical protein ACLP50_29120 [Solirubrobacteraceae bacterium]